MPGGDFTVGVISDTHGVLRPAAVRALEGSDAIVHAGDIGAPDVLEGLLRIAPVTAVRGNVDRSTWSAHLPETAALELGAVWLYVLHDLDRIDLEPGDIFAVVISGHTHRPAMSRRGRVLYFNPGSAGPRRGDLPVSVGRLHVRGAQVRGELLDLETGASIGR